MNRIAVGLAVAVFTVASTAHAGKSPDTTCVIDAAKWGTVIAADDMANLWIEDGNKPVHTNIFGVYSDAGFFGPSYMVFKLPSFKSPVLFGKLRLKMRVNSTFDDRPKIALSLHDVEDLPFLLQPMWDFSQWQAAKTDLMSGREYGDFSVPATPIPVEDGITIEAPLSYDAIYDINDAAGELFAIGMGPGDIGTWSTEGEYVYFLKPEEDGVIQLELTVLPGAGKDACKKDHH